MDAGSGLDVPRARITAQPSPGVKRPTIHNAYQPARVHTLQGYGSISPSQSQIDWRSIGEIEVGDPPLSARSRYLDEVWKSLGLKITGRRIRPEFNTGPVLRSG